MGFNSGFKGLNYSVFFFLGARWRGVINYRPPGALLFLILLQSALQPLVGFGAALLQGMKSDTHCTGGWVDPTDSLDG